MEKRFVWIALRSTAEDFDENRGEISA